MPRELFLVTLSSRECMANRNREKDDLFYGLILSSHAFFACCLDNSAILAIRRWLPKTEFEKFIANERPVAGESQPSIPTEKLVRLDRSGLM
jgi:hypothetical protein